MYDSFPDALPTLYETAPYIIIGSGIAGLYAALKLSSSGRVVLITKSSLTESNTHYAQGGIAAAISPNDSPDLHYQDTLMAGAGLCDPEAVRTLVDEGPVRVRELINLGVPFDRIQNGLALTREAAHSRNRILHAEGDATGRAISNTLIQLVRQKPIQIYEQHYATALITQNGHCCGVVTIAEGRLHLFLGGAIILCTGGLGQIYSKTTNPQVATGDGIALAYRCGAAIRDMEFVQFHPTALYLPPAPPFLISESVRGEGAVLLNSSGHRFMPELHPLAELAPRDIVARAIFTEIQNDNSGCVYLDLSRIQPATIRSRFPNIYETCLKYGLDITCDLIPVAPAAHYMMGGVLTDGLGRTTIPGLFAAGETASTGVHGANRLASNSLLEGLVFAGRIADSLREQTPKIPQTTTNLEVHYPRLYTDYTTLKRDYQELHHITDHNLGIVRQESGLKQAIEDLGCPPPPAPFPLEPAYLELQQMRETALLIAKAAYCRTESRGGHFRSDYPTASDDWRKHIILRGESMELDS